MGPFAQILSSRFFLNVWPQKSLDKGTFPKDPPPRGDAGPFLMTLSTDPREREVNARGE